MKCLPEEFLAFLPRGLVTAAIISHEREREKRYAKIQQQTKHKNSEYQAKDGMN